MMIHKYCSKIFFLIFITSVFIHSQQLTGVVVDSTNGLPIANVKVGLIDYDKGRFTNFVKTDAGGHFSLNSTTSLENLNFLPFPQFKKSPYIHFFDLTGREIQSKNVRTEDHLLFQNFVENNFSGKKNQKISARTTGSIRLIFVKANFGPRFLDVSSSQKDIQIKMRSNMVSLSANSFSMGQIGIAEPVHKVTLSAFSIQETEVTQEQYISIIGTNPSNFNFGTSTLNYPVEMINWFDAIKYCNALSRVCDLDEVYDTTTWAMDMSRNGYRLPTEAEWEYAARGGTTEKYFWNNENVDPYAWYLENSHETTHPVATKKQNPWGLFDMVGNVWEWCYDWYTGYASSDQNNPINIDGGSLRAVRGGSFGLDTVYLSSSHRSAYSPRINDYSRYAGGLRVVRKIP